MGKKNNTAESMGLTITPQVSRAPVQQDSSVEAMIQTALTNKVDIGVMERLLAMRKEVMTDRARAAFVQAMAEFQANCPVIEKTKKVIGKDGRVRYQFAPIDAIVEQIRVPVAQAGLSYRWTATQDTTQITAVFHVTHVLGHTETSDFSVPIGGTEFMTAPQAVAAALTFAKRYSMLNGLGIATGDEDTDATNVKKEPDAKSPKAKIMFLLKTLDEKTSTKEEASAAVERLTGLMLEDKNFGAIIKKLEAYVIAKNHEDPAIQ